MVTKEFADASAEISEILRCFPEELINKIPKKLISFFDEVKTPNYNVTINHNTPIEMQEIKTKTKKILLVIYIKYLCDDKELERKGS